MRGWPLRRVNGANDPRVEGERRARARARRGKITPTRPGHTGSQRHEGPWGDGQSVTRNRKVSKSPGLGKKRWEFKLEQGLPEERGPAALGRLSSDKGAGRAPSSQRGLSACNRGSARMFACRADYGGCFCNHQGTCFTKTSPCDTMTAAQ